MQSPQTFLAGRVVLHAGDCLDVLKTLPSNSLDSCVTDPPYHLTSIVKRFGVDNAASAKAGKTGAYARASRGFMGKTWDGGDIAFRPELWVEVLRVLKPGAHLLAFSGTRTYHRMACAIEDAGFDIRDLCSWSFGSGFPKSRNVFRELQDKGLACSCRGTRLSSHYVSDEDVRGLQGRLDACNEVSIGQEQNLRAGMQGGNDPSSSDRSPIEDATVRRSSVPNLRGHGSPATEPCSTIQAGLLQPLVPVEDLCGEVDALRREYARTSSRAAIRSSEPCLEGRNNVKAKQGLSCGCGLCALPEAAIGNGPQGRICDAAPSCDGRVGGTATDQDRVRASSQSQGTRRSKTKPRTVADECGSQAWGGWPVCDRCSKPVVPEGLGSALKPALEPICLARKPLSEGTVAANVLRWGTGALNIDGCRVEAHDGASTARKPSSTANTTSYGKSEKMGGNGSDSGRWPANVITDGSDEVLAAFPQNEQGHVGDSGSAARFFASFPQKRECRCALCHSLCDASSDIDFACDAITAAPNSQTQNILAAVSARGDAADSTLRESGGRSKVHRSSAQSVAAVSSDCHQPSENSAPSNAEIEPLSNLALRVRYAGNLCDSCATAIAQSLAALTLGQNPASLQLPASISERSAQILRRSLALHVEGRLNIAITTTTANLKMLFGSVFHAIDSTTQELRAESEKATTQSASRRLFYSAKADSSDRIGSTHPTVKPVDLMQYLVRLVTPPGATTIDPFAGTGTTGEAAWREGMNAILIEREEPYRVDIARRMALCLAGPDERARASIKARHGDLPAGPLFDLLGAV